MPPATFTPADLLKRTVREARKRRGNALFAARLQAKHGRAPSLAFLEFLHNEATTALDKKYLKESDGENKRVLVQIMADNGRGQPTFYYDHAHILVDPTLFEVLAEVDRVFVEKCAGIAPRTSSSSLCDALPIDSYSDDGNDDLYTVRTVYTSSRALLKTCLLGLVK